MAERKSMHLARRFAFFALILAALMLSRSVRADDLNQVLQKLDGAAKNFTNVITDVEFKTVMTVPVPDTDTMNGVAYYERNNGHFKMAAHIHQRNGQPAALTYILSGGVLRESDTGKESDVHTINQASKYESYLGLGFGASGSDLQAKWDIKYDGTEILDGVQTDKLELVAKDPTVRKNLPKVTIWLDTARAVSIKQVFDQGDGTTRTSHYTNIKTGQKKLPGDAFVFAK
jgi:outer membrane lipoprotein-sorting protein